MKRLILLIAPLFAILSCTTEKNLYLSPNFELNASKIYGEYSLVKVLWTGSQTDLNGDGLAGWHILDELSTTVGYWEPYHVASVNKASQILINSEQSAFAVAFNLLLPYPYLVMQDDGDISCISTKYLRKTLRAEDIVLHNNCCKIEFNCFSQSDIFLSNLKWMELYMDSYDDERFKIVLECSLPCYTGINEVKMTEASLVYEFIAQR